MILCPGKTRLGTPDLSTFGEAQMNESRTHLSRNPRLPNTPRQHPGCTTRDAVPDMSSKCPPPCPHTHIPTPVTQGQHEGEKSEHKERRTVASEAAKARGSCEMVSEGKKEILESRCGGLSLYHGPCGKYRFLPNTRIRRLATVPGRDDV